MCDCISKGLTHIFNITYRQTVTCDLIWIKSCALKVGKSDETHICEWSFMRLTTRTNLATRILMTCAVNDGATVRTSQIAEKCNASNNHLLQVVHQLHSGGYVDTIRGRNGGLRLARPMEQISIGEVFRLFESHTPFAECFDAQTNTCPLSKTCRLRSFIGRALDAFYHELDMITLSDLVKGNCGLSAILDLAPQLSSSCSPSEPVA